MISNILREANILTIIWGMVDKFHKNIENRELSQNITFIPPLHDLGNTGRRGRESNEIRRTANAIFGTQHSTAKPVSTAAGVTYY